MALYNLTAFNTSYDLTPGIPAAIASLKRKLQNIVDYMPDFAIVEGINYQVKRMTNYIIDGLDFYGTYKNSFQNFAAWYYGVKMERRANETIGDYLKSRGAMLSRFEYATKEAEKKITPKIEIAEAYLPSNSVGLLPALIPLAAIVGIAGIMIYAIYKSPAIMELFLARNKLEQDMKNFDLIPAALKKGMSGEELAAYVTNLRNVQVINSASGADLQKILDNFHEAQQRLQSGNTNMLLIAGAALIGILFLSKKKA